MRLPDIAVPRGVHGAQNAPLTRFTCSLTGAYLAFAPSVLAARYKDGSDYVDRIRTAARAVQAEGFLLPEDAAVIVDAAASTPIFAQKTAAAPPR